MQEKWNSFVYALIESQKKDVDETRYQESIENQLLFLGWKPYADEICHKPNVPIGNGKHIQPDILVRCNDEDLFVIEVKRPNHKLSAHDRQQLQSYMRQLKIQVGVYIGEHIEVFYDTPSQKDAVSVLETPLALDSRQGIKFAERFSKENYSKEAILAFCEERIKEKQRQANLEKIKDSLIADAQQQISESLIPYLIDKYGKSFSEDELRGMLSSLKFEIIRNDKNTDKDTDPGTNKKTSKDTSDTTSTKYTLNGSPRLNTNKLAYAIVKLYLEQHPGISYNELEQIFPPQLQGSPGTIRTLKYIQERQYKGRRFFDRPDEILVCGDSVTFAVSTQWSKNNINNIINVAQKLGYKISATNSVMQQLEDAATKEDDIVHCFLKRNADAHGIFHISSQTLVVQKGSIVNSNHLPNTAGKKKETREAQLIKYTKLVDGKNIVTTDIEFKSPSGAALFCVGGSSNGWSEWKDSEHNELSKYRK